jgi:hypothetical protein
MPFTTYVSKMEKITILTKLKISKKETSDAKGHVDDDSGAAKVMDKKNNKY